MENTTFQNILEQVVLSQNPELYVYAAKVHKNLLDVPKSIIIRVHKDSPMFPKPPVGYKFKDPESYAYIRVNVMSHNVFSNQVLLEDGTWVEPKNRMENESSWINDIRPIEEPRIPTKDEDIF